MSGSLPVDMELKKAFQELQAKMIDTTQKIKMADIQIEALKRGIHHAKLTDTEVMALPNDTKVYQGIGRMFILTKTSDVHGTVENKIKGSEERIKTLEGSKSYLERSLKESEDNLREMIANKQKSTMP